MPLASMAWRAARIRSTASGKSKSGLRRVPRGILDRDPGQPRPHRPRNVGADRFRLGGEAAPEVPVDRDRHARGERAEVRERLVQRRLRVAPPL